jgi:ABC-type transport system involved in multi-copper enzyme maturation permease subunit
VTVALRAEARKLLTTQVWFWMVVLTAALSLLVASLVSAFTSTDDAGIPIEALLNGVVGFAVLIASVLGVIGVTGEYRHLTVTPTFLSVPRRGTVITAKLVTYLITGLALGVLTVALALAVATPWLRGRGFEVDLGASSTIRIIVGGIIASGIWGVIGIGVGALLRNQVAAVVGIVLYRFLIEGILSAIPKVKSAYPYLPGGATNSLLTTADPNVNDGSLHFLSPWVGGALLLAYGLVFAIIGTLLTVRRDVT